MAPALGKSPDWEGHRHIFVELYWNQDMELRAVKQKMEVDYNFRATQKQFKKKIKDWNLKKNISLEEYTSMLKMQEWRRFHYGKTSMFTIRGKPVDGAKLQRYKRNNRSTTRLDEHERDGPIQAITQPGIRVQTPDPSCSDKFTSNVLIGINSNKDDTAVNNVWNEAQDYDNLVTAVEQHANPTSSAPTVPLPSIARSPWDHPTTMNGGYNDQFGGNSTVHHVRHACQCCPQNQHTYSPPYTYGVGDITAGSLSPSNLPFSDLGFQDHACNEAQSWDATNSEDPTIKAYLSSPTTFYLDSARENGNGLFTHDNSLHLSRPQLLTVNNSHDGRLLMEQGTENHGSFWDGDQPYYDDWTHQASPFLPTSPVPALFSPSQTETPALTPPQITPNYFTSGSTSPTPSSVSPGSPAKGRSHKD